MKTNLTTYFDLLQKPADSTPQQATGPPRQVLVIAVQDHLKQRMTKLENRLQEEGLDAYLIINIESSDKMNIRYFSDFQCSMGLIIIGGGNPVFLTDSRYYEAAKQEIDGFKIKKINANPVETLAEYLTKTKLRKIGVAKERISLKDYETLKNSLQDRTIKGVEQLTVPLRAIKDKRELKYQREASKITDDALRHAIEFVRPRQTEKELALEIEMFIKKEADDVAFNPIVASGPNSALPHAHPTDRPIKKGRFLLFDIGARVNGYCSDLTRTIFLGPPTSKATEIYNLVLKAQKEGLKALKPGADTFDVDSRARSIIKKGGYGEQFGHGLGHGVGLDVHENPRISQNNPTELQKGMVVTVEPGIYIPDWGGVRIEDTVVITERGYSRLTQSGKSELLDPLSV